MAEEEVKTTETTETKSEEAQDDDRGNKKLYIIGGLIAGIVVLFGIFYALASSGNETASRVISPIIKVTYPTSEPTPTADSSIKEGTSTLAGTTSVEGSPASGNTISVAARARGAESYQVIQEGISPSGTQEWSWSKAVEGVTYEVQSFLISGGEIDAQSKVASVTAPTSGTALTVILSTLPPPPDGTLQVNCVDKNSSGKWNVSLTYNINNPTSPALQYRVGIGTSRTGDLILDAVVKPSSPDVTQTYNTDYIINDNQTYFAAYAYATCADCDEFSEASTWVQFSCSGNPATATPEPTAASSPTPELEALPQ